MQMHTSSDLPTSHYADILGHLDDGEALTQESARAKFGCSRLAARIWDLKQAGYPVAKRMVRDETGRLVAEYFMKDR